MPMHHESQPASHRRRRARACRLRRLFVQRRSIRAERAHPPLGRFITIDGRRLHYLDEGDGPPLVLLHGLGSMVEDFVLSGLVREASKRYRVIAIDRPGYGHSARPRRLRFGAAAQAGLVRKALQSARRASPHRPRPFLGDAGRGRAGARPSGSAAQPGARLGALFPELAAGRAADRSRRRFRSSAIFSAVRSRRSRGARCGPDY